MAPPCTVTVSLVISRTAFIFDILISVPPSAVPQGDVEWFEPTARTGEGYWPGFFKTATMSSVEAASTMTAGCDVMFPNQLVTVSGMIGLFYPPKVHTQMAVVPFSAEEGMKRHRSAHAGGCFPAWSRSFGARPAADHPSASGWSGVAAGSLARCTRKVLRS